jgi:hypothetical protein
MSEVSAGLIVAIFQARGHLFNGLLIDHPQCSDRRQAHEFIGGR